jgi:hypothetical protein
MSQFLLYLLKFSVTLAAVYLFYSLLLQPLTFFTWNRWFLILYCVLALATPLVNVEPLVESSQMKPIVFIRELLTLQGNLGQSPSACSLPSRPAGLAFRSVLTILVLTGSALLATRLLIRFWSLTKMKQKAEILTQDGVSIYHL